MVEEEDGRDQDMNGIFNESGEEADSEDIEGEMGKRWKLKKGVMLDLGTRDVNGEMWNFDDQEKRNKIRMYIKYRKPRLVVGSHIQAVVDNMSEEELMEMSADTQEDIKRRNKEHQ